MVKLQYRLANSDILTIYISMCQFKKHQTQISYIIKTHKKLNFLTG